MWSEKHGVRTESFSERYAPITAGSGHFGVTCKNAAICRAYVDLGIEVVVQSFEVSEVCKHIEMFV